MDIEAADRGSDELESLVGLFRLLSDRTRLSILLILLDGERNVTSLCRQLKLPQPTVSHHLGLLRSRKLISNLRRGKQVFYGLSAPIDTGADSVMNIDAAPFRVRVSRRVAASE